jgi:hypothetical protein
MPHHRPTVLVLTCIHDRSGQRRIGASNPSDQRGAPPAPMLAAPAGAHAGRFDSP